MMGVSHHFLLCKRKSPNSARIPGELSAACLAKSSSAEPSSGGEDFESVIYSLGGMGAEGEIGLIWDEQARDDHFIASGFTRKTTSRGELRVES